MTKKLALEEWHGCFTGDCPHDKQEECDSAIAAAREIERLETELCEMINSTTLEVIEQILPEGKNDIGRQLSLSFPEFSVQVLIVKVKHPKKLTVECRNCGEPMEDKGAATQWCSEECRKQSPA